MQIGTSSPVDVVRNKAKEENKHLDKIMEGRSELGENQEMEIGGGSEENEEQRELEEQILEKKVKIVILFFLTCSFISRHPFFNRNKNLSCFSESSSRKLCACNVCSNS